VRVAGGAVEGAGVAYILDWPRSADGGGPEVSIGLSVTTHAAPHEPVPANTDVRGHPASIEHSSDADAISWDWSPTVSIRLTSNARDYRVNCQELLAIARSVDEYSPRATG
jgi:hypothetical protein